MKPDHIEYGKEYLDKHQNPVIAVGECNGAIVGMVHNYFGSGWEPKIFMPDALAEWKDPPTSFERELYIGWLSNGVCHVLEHYDLRKDQKNYVAIKRVTVSANKGEIEYPEKGE